MRTEGAGHVVMPRWLCDGERDGHMVRESGVTGDEGREPVEGAAGLPDGSFFAGRTGVLGRITAWLEADGAGLFLVTGPAGCGKSAVLDRIATLNGPVRRQETGAHESDPDDPRLRRPLASVLLRNLSPLRAASELARQLGLPEPFDTDDFRAGLRALSPQPVLVLDGLDEVPAEHLRAMIEELVLPLGRTSQVLLGSRERVPRPHRGGRVPGRDPAGRPRPADRRGGHRRGPGAGAAHPRRYR